MRSICAAILVILSTNAYSECVKNSCRGVTIDRVFINPDGSNFRFGTSGDETNLDCTSDKYITLDMTKAYARETYAAILAAHQSKNDFWIKTTGANTDCSVVYIVSDK